MSAEEPIRQEDAEESNDNSNWNKSADFVSFGDNDEEEDEQALQEEETAHVSGDSLPPWMANATPRRVNPLVALHNEIVDFTTLMAPLPHEIQERKELIERFRKVAHIAFGGTDKCEVTVFGSQATGLFLPTSDVDLVITFKKDENDTKQGGKDGKRTQQEMEKWDDPSATPLPSLAAALRQEWRNELSYLELIENTRVPLVKFTHGPTGISFDVCFDQDTGPRAAFLMKTYMDAMPPLRPLAFVLKYFMDARAINEPYTGGVGSFMLQLMIVSFLQHRERDGYNYRRPSLYNLGALLVEFFELYGMDFNYVTTGISVRFDGFYFPKGAKERKDDFWQSNRPFSLALENPLDPKHDVGKPSYRIQNVARAFELAFKTLLAHLTEPRVPAFSVLASILPPTAEMKKRAAMKQMGPQRALAHASSRRSSSGGSNMDESSGSDSPSMPKAKRRKH